MGFLQATSGDFNKIGKNVFLIMRLNYWRIKMKRVLYVLLCVVMALSFQSCNDKVETATLRIEMNKSVRTVSPDRDNMEIYGYRVVAIGPDGKESTPRYTYYTYLNLDNLSVGEWTIKVYGFNKDRVDICYGEETITLTAGKNNAKINVDQLVGKGSMTLTLNWNDTAYPKAKSVKVTLNAQDGTEISLIPSEPNNCSVVVSKDNMDTGSYKFTAKLLDSDGNTLSGIAEAIRISNGEKTEGEITFPFSAGSETGNGEIEISNNTSLPVEVEINGLESLIEENKTFTLNISLPKSSPLTLNDLDTVWFLDGEEVGRGSEFTFTGGVKSGIHRIDVITQTKDKGSMGSNGKSFQAAANTNHGDPYQKYTLQEGKEWKLGAGVTIHFLPDNRLLIASNQYKTVQLVRADGVSPVVESEYTYSDLGFDGNVADFTAYGEEDDGFWNVVFLINQNLSCKAVNVMVSKTQLIVTDEATGFDPKGGDGRADKFVSIVPCKNTLVATIQSNDRKRMGLVLVNQNAEKGNMVRRDDWYSVDPQIEWGGTGFKNSASIPEMGFIMVTSGERSKVYNFKGTDTISISEHMMWKDEDVFFEYYAQNKFKAEFLDARSCGFLSRDGDYAFVFTPSAIHYYKREYGNFDEYTLYHTENITEDGTSIIKMAPDTEYCYLLDNKNGRLYTMRSENSWNDGGLVLKKGSWIDCDVQGANEIEISLSGEYLAVYNKTTTSCINIIKTAR